MSVVPSDDPSAVRDNQRRIERGRRTKVVIACSAAVAVIDVLLSYWVIPWVDRQDWAMTRHGSVGFVIYFVMVFFTFMAFVALVAYFFSRSSYPSDGWN